MKLKLFTLLLIFFSTLTTYIQGQTCPGEVLNISATSHSTSGTAGSWTVPAGGIYKVRVTAKGAAGGDRLVFPVNTGGNGATMTGDFFVTSGQVLQAIAGTRGQSASQVGGGGGGSGVQIQSSGLLLVLAGGGGGAGANTSGGVGSGGLITNSGSNGGSASNGGGGGGGYSGNGQNSSNSFSGGGGGGGYDGKGGFAPMNSGDIGFGGGGFGSGGGGGSICSAANSCAGTGFYYGGGGGGGYSGGNGGIGSGGNIGSGGSGGGSYNIGTNQSNFQNANLSGGQVVIQCLGTATISAVVTPSLPPCGSTQGSINIDLTGDLDGISSNSVEYAIVSGSSFSGNPTFTSIDVEPFDVNTGVGTTAGTYTVRIRLKYNPDIFTDQTYTLGTRSTTVYVKYDATGANNGTSWTDAFRSLQDALLAACSGAEIWVAAGTYKPTSGTDRSISFVMRNGIAIYGGFNGMESQRSQRNWTLNETILSGDIGTVGQSFDNTYTVIKNANNGLTPANAVLDGFTVTGGDNLGNGGGMYNVNASPSINNCKFISNYAANGAGVYNQNASPTLTNCTFSNNTGYDFGAGMYNGSNSNPVLTNVSFLNNQSGEGGGLYNLTSSPTLINCFLSGNYGRNGGGIHNANNSSPTLRSVSFVGNRAEWGGGIYNNTSSSPNLTNCIFSGNSSGNDGGGMRNTNSAPILTNVTFTGNLALEKGGGIANLNSNPVLKNCILWGNSSEVFSSEVYNDANSSPNYTYCLVQRLNPTGVGNLNGTLATNNPLFVSQPDFMTAPTTAGDLRLRQCSPAIDAGTATDAPTTDLDGNNRVDANPGGGIVDIGAYEYQSAGISGGIVYVNASASGSNNGSSWANAFTDLQSALSLARANPSCVSQIWVAKGTYRPTSGTDRTISFSMVNGVAIYGGFNGTTETQLSQRNWATNVTTLSGDIGTAGNDLDNSYHVVLNGNNGLNNTAILDGFTITKGYANSSGGNESGGGVANFSSSPKIVNCIFTDNYSIGDGGGLINYTSSSVIVNCIFRENTSSGTGAAVTNSSGSQPQFINCSFTKNSGSSTIHCNNSSPIVLTNSIVWGNNTSSILFSSSSVPNVTYSIVQGGLMGTGNLNADPLFVDAANGNLRLRQCSPAIDAGTTTDAPNTDFDGHLRMDAVSGGGVVDIGAYEYQSTYDFCYACANTTGGIVYVNASASGSKNGSSWANAFTDLQSALSLARSNPSCVSQIWVAAGTYYPDEGTGQTNNDRNAAFSMINGVALYGGFPNDNTGRMENRNWAVYETILSGDIDQNDNTTGNANNSYQVIFNDNNGLTNTAILDGFTVTSARGEGASGYMAYGTGLFNNNCGSPSIINCVFKNHKTTLIGGGIVNIAASPTIGHCIFINNNGSNLVGGIVSLFSYSATITSCTFYGNQIGIYNQDSPTQLIRNCIVWGNGTSFYSGQNSSFSATYSIIQHSIPQTQGVGNLFVNPLFRDAANGDLRLQACSPAINAGDPATTSAIVGNVDLGGNPRFYDNGRIDIGAYEYQGTFDAVAPAAQVTNSTCTTVGGTPSGGVISAPSGSCPVGSTLYYSINNGGNWSTTLPIYAQTGPEQTILTRCACDANPTSFGLTSSVTTHPGTCPTCPVLTAAAPAVQVTNSVCTTFGGTASGGVISAPSGSCPAGSTLQYSTDNGGNWNETLPTYAQTGPAQMILTRCTCGANSSPTSTVTTVPGTCPTCPDLAAAAPAVQVTNSVCTTFGGTASGGVISAPSSSCPVGSTLQYSTDNGGNWSETLPTYAQTGPAQTILTRCTCGVNSSPTSTVTTVPGTCPTCPNLTAAAPAVQVTNSVCTTFGGTASGGSISAPSSSCPVGSTLQYSTDNGGNWSETLPTYGQTGPAQTILTRCTCGVNSSPTSTVTTVPGTCPTCPNLTSAAPAVQVTNSVCTTFGGTASGGSISAPSSSCPVGSTLYYSTDNGGNWSKTLPTYVQAGPAQTILTRCTCDANANTSSPTSTVATVPGVCPACPVLTSAAPVVQVTNSVCTTFGGTASGGSISAPSSSCPSGSTLYYSTDNGGNWSKTLPTYVQAGPAQTILTRCTCDANANTSSPTSTVTTVPGVCPACPDLTAAAPAVQVTNSVCQTGCVIGGGSIAVPSTSCSVGSTLQYQLNGGDWSTTLPTYVQTGPAQTIKTRCVCNSNASQTSPESSVTTVPGTVPMLVVPSNGSAVVSCPALATLPVPPVVNDCSGAAITPSSPTITNSPDPLTCEGTRTYTYTYVCGTRTASWSFVYTIEREGFTVNTPNGSATVYDASLAVAPTPPTVLSQCGETLTPSAPVITNSPNPLVCEGTRTYTYTFTDCEGNTASWSYAYTILDNIAPTITCPANITACEGQTITFTPPVGTDNCLGAVTTQIAGLPTSSLYPVGITTNTYKVTATNGQSSTCSFTVTVQGKPTIMLSTLQQTLNEGNNPVLCDTDANPVNSLQFTVSGLCVSGSPVWRVQVGSGAWSDWSPNAPVSQPSNNQPHRYQAACDGNCASTYSGVIELTINNRATVPQKVSLLVDGVTVLVGESKEVCSLVTIPLTFNANCAAGEVTLYSVDGGEYSSGVPIGLVDNQFHNYRVRCRKSDGTPSCVESESGVMRLKLVTIPTAPTVSLSSTSSCDATASFSGLSNCGNLRTVWYNATTNVALPNLPSTVPSQTTSYYARCQTENGCVSERSNVVTFTLAPTQVAPVITASQEIVCTGTSVTISANCPAGSQTFWNTGVTTPSFEVSFNNVTKQTYWAKCIFVGGCQSSESVRKDIYWNAFVVTLINVGESKSSVKVNDRAAWTNQFITRDGGPELEQSTQQNPTLYYVENVNKVAPRYWTINVEACGLSTDGSLTFDMLATPEMGVIRSFNTHENNAPYFMYANREGWTELYAQNHPAYGFYQDNGAGGNVYDAGLPKGLYKLGVRYWDQKGWGSIYPSTRKPQGNVLAYQEYWFRIQSKNGVGVGAAREAISDLSSRRDLKPADNGSFATILPNPVTNTLRLQVQNSKEQVVQTTLTDASGREVLNRQFVPETNSHQEEFEVGELPTGMYFLRVTTPDRQTTLKVVKLE